MDRDTDSGKHLWSERCTSALVEKFDAVMTSIGFTRSTFDCLCLLSQEHCLKPGGNFVCSRGRHNLWWIGSFVFPKLCHICAIVFHFVSGKLEKGCSAAPSMCRTT